MLKHIRTNWAWWLGLFVALFVVVFPIYVMFKYSISDRASIITGGMYPEPLWPFHPTTEMFEYLLSRDDFTVAGLISVKVALYTVALSLLLGTPAAYALARFRFPGYGVLLFSLISIRLFPDISTVIPLVEVFFNSPLSRLPVDIQVALSHTLLSLPYVIYIAMGVFETVPKDLEEQAAILGCSRLGAFLRIVLPVAAPGLAAGAIYTFLLSWNEFIFSYYLTFTSPEGTTLPVYLLRILNWTPQKNLLAALSLVISLPVILFTFLVQKYMRAGLTAGAVK
ncbi:MAG TPA: carbohydrate ABC transporter permease [Symbiobacteriaceae bacterium]